MAENRFPGCSGGNAGREIIAIDTDRILDCCRDRDCYEDTPVFLTVYGQELVERATAVRIKSTEVVWAQMDIDPIQFNHGFYAIHILFYVKLVLEANVGIGRPQEFEGLVILEKKVILFGSESNISSFTSQNRQPVEVPESNPLATVDVVAPVALNVRIQERPCKNYPCCSCEIPESILNCINGPLANEANGPRMLLASLGLFTVVRLTRPCQCLVNATEYSVPDKECVPGETEDPCRMFRAMDFPTGEFNAGAVPPPAPPMNDPRPCRCSSQNQ